MEAVSETDEDMDYPQSEDASLTHQLAVKVRMQAQRLTALEQYRLLCEHRIVDLVPDHPLPVMPEHIGRSGGDRTKLELHQALQRVARLEQQLAERGGNEGNSGNLLREKSDLEESLRVEVLRNEEQRAYIEALKQALEEKMETQGYTGSVDAYSDLIQARNMLTKLQREHSKCALTLQTTEHQLATEHQAALTAQTQAQTLSRELQEVTAALQQDVQEMAKLEEEKTALLDYVHDHADTHTHLNDTITHLDSQLKLSTNEVNRLKSDLETAEKRLKSFESTHHDTRFSLESQLQSTLTRLKTTETELESMSQSLKIANSRNEQLQANYSTLSSTLKETTEELDRVKAEYQRLLEEIKSDKTARIEGNMKVKELEMERNRMESEYKQALERISEADQRILKLKHKKQAKVTEIQNRQEATLRENSTLKQRLQEIETELHGLNQEHLNQSSHFQGENHQLRSTIESLKLQLDEIQREKTENEAKIAQKFEESGLKSLQIEVKRLGMTQTSLQRRCDLLTEENSVLRAELAQNQTQNREINAELRENQRKLMELMSENEDLRRNLDGLQTDLDKINSDTQSIAEEAFRTRQKEHKTSQSLLEKEQEMAVLKRFMVESVAEVVSFVSNFGAVCMVSGSYGSVVSEDMKGVISRWSSWEANTEETEAVCIYLQAWVQSSVHELEALIRRIVELKVEVVATQQRYSHADKRLKSSENCEIDLKVKESVTLRDLKSAHEENLCLKSELNDTERELVTVKEELARSQLEAGRLAAEIQRLQQELDVYASPVMRWQGPAAEAEDLFVQRAMEEKLGLLVREKRELEAVMVRVKQAVEKKELKKVIEEWMTLRGELEVCERDRLRLSSLVTIKEKDSRSHSDLRLLKDQLARTESQISILKRNISHLNGQLSDLERGIPLSPPSFPVKPDMEGPPPPPSHSNSIDQRVLRLAGKETRPRLTIQDKLEQARTELGLLRKRPLV